MRDWLLRNANIEYSARRRLTLMALAGLFFMILLPVALVQLGGRLDDALGWPAFARAPVNAIVGGLMVLAGAGLGLWSN